MSDIPSGPDDNRGISQPEDSTDAEIDRRRWFIKGARGVISIPALVLMSSFIGFAGFAREAGFGWGETVFMVGTIWALPSHLVLVGGVIAGASTLTIIVGVSLASVRLMPMVMAQMPILRGSNTSRWTLFFLAHFIAITSWVFLQTRYENVPRDARTSFFAGFGITIMAICTILVGLTHALAAVFPPVIAAGLFFLTPIYFLTSLWGAANLSSDKLAMVFGLVLGPLLHFVVPQVDVLIAGLVGGLAAFVFGQMAATRRMSGR